MVLAYQETGKARSNSAEKLFFILAKLETFFYKIYETVEMWELFEQNIRQKSKSQLRMIRTTSKDSKTRSPHN